MNILAKEKVNLGELFEGLFVNVLISKLTQHLKVLPKTISGSLTRLGNEHEDCESSRDEAVGLRNITFCEETAESSFNESALPILGEGLHVIFDVVWVRAEI